MDNFFNTSIYNIMIQAVNILAMLFQGYCLQNLYGSFLESRLKSRRQTGCIIIVGWVLLKLILSYFFPSNYDSVKTFAKLIFLMGVLIAVAVFLYQGAVALKLYLSVTFMAFAEISFFLAYMILILGNHLFSFWSWCINQGYIISPVLAQTVFEITSFVLQVLVYVAFSVLTYFLIIILKNKYQKKNYIMQKTELMFILTPSMTGLLLCIFLRMIIVTVEQGIPVLLYDRYPLLVVVIPAVLTLSLLSILYGVKLFQDMVVLNQEKQRRVIMEQQIKGLQNHVNEMERVYSGIRGMRHDIKNQMAVVMQLVEQIKNKEDISTEWNRYLLELNRSIDRLELQFRTGNVVADAILNMKFHEAKSKMENIRIEVDNLIFPKDLKIESYDLAVILCNALDNAIEACEKMSFDEERFLCASSFQNGKMFFLKFENSFSGKIKIEKGAEFPTTGKKNKELHGIGFYNMKLSVQKYYGALDWEIEGEVFQLTVMMQNKEATTELK